MNARSLWLLGAGNMGGAMLRGWLDVKQGLAVSVVDPIASEVPDGVTLWRDVPVGVEPFVVSGVAKRGGDAHVGLRIGSVADVLGGAGVEREVDHPGDFGLTSNSDVDLGAD